MLKKTKQATKVTKATSVTDRVNLGALEDILVEVKSGKKSINAAISEIDNLYETTARFVGLDQGHQHLTLLEKHQPIILKAVSDQHDDLQQLIKAIKEK